MINKEMFKSSEVTFDFIVTLDSLKMHFKKFTILKSFEKFVAF